MKYRVVKMLKAIFPSHFSLQSRRSGDDLDEVSGDAGLPLAVVGQGQALDHLVC